MSALHRAAAKGDCDWIRSELAAGADVNARDRDGATPLHRAALEGHIDVCRLLVAAGASAVAEDKDGVTVVDYAKLANECIGAKGVGELLRVLRSGLTE